MIPLSVQSLYEISFRKIDSLRDNTLGEQEQMEDKKKKKKTKHLKAWAKKEKLLKKKMEFTQRELGLNHFRNEKIRDQSGVVTEYHTCHIVSQLLALQAKFKGEFRYANLSIEFDYNRKEYYLEYYKRRNNGPFMDPNWQLFVATWGNRVSYFILDLSFFDYFKKEFSCYIINDFRPLLVNFKWNFIENNLAKFKTYLDRKIQERNIEKHILKTHYLVYNRGRVGEEEGEVEMDDFSVGELIDTLQNDPGERTLCPILLAKVVLYGNHTMKAFPGKVFLDENASEEEQRQRGNETNFENCKEYLFFRIDYDHGDLLKIQNFFFNRFEIVFKKIRVDIYEGAGIKDLGRNYELLDRCLEWDMGKYHYLCEFLRIRTIDFLDYNHNNTRFVSLIIDEFKGFKGDYPKSLIHEFKNDKFDLEKEELILSASKSKKKDPLINGVVEGEGGPKKENKVKRRELDLSRLQNKPKSKVFTNSKKNSVKKISEEIKGQIQNIEMKKEESILGMSETSEDEWGLKKVESGDTGKGSTKTTDCQAKKENMETVEIKGEVDKNKLEVEKKLKKEESPKKKEKKIDPKDLPEELPLGKEIHLGEECKMMEQSEIIEMNPKKIQKERKKILKEFKKPLLIDPAIVTTYLNGKEIFLEINRKVEYLERKMPNYLLRKIEHADYKIEFINLDKDVMGFYSIEHMHPLSYLESLDEEVNNINVISNLINLHRQKMFPMTEQCMINFALRRGNQGEFLVRERDVFRQAHTDITKVVVDILVTEKLGGFQLFYYHPNSPWMKHKPKLTDREKEIFSQMPNLKNLKFAKPVLQQTKIDADLRLLEIEAYENIKQNFIVRDINFLESIRIKGETESEYLRKFKYMMMFTFYHEFSDYSRSRTVGKFMGTSNSGKKNRAKRFKKLVSTLNLNDKDLVNLLISFFNADNERGLYENYSTEAIKKDFKQLDKSLNSRLREVNRMKVRIISFPSTVSKVLELDCKEDFIVYQIGKGGNQWTGTEVVKTFRSKGGNEEYLLAVRGDLGVVKKIKNQCKGNRKKTHISCGQCKDSYEAIRSTLKFFQHVILDSENFRVFHNMDFAEARSKYEECLEKERADYQWLDDSVEIDVQFIDTDSLNLVYEKSDPADNEKTLLIGHESATPERIKLQKEVKKPQTKTGLDPKGFEDEKKCEKVTQFNLKGDSKDDIFKIDLDIVKKENKKVEEIKPQILEEGEKLKDDKTGESLVGEGGQEEETQPKEASANKTKEMLDLEFNNLKKHLDFVGGLKLVPSSNGMTMNASRMEDVTENKLHDIIELSYSEETDSKKLRKIMEKKEEYKKRINIKNTSGTKKSEAKEEEKKKENDEQIPLEEPEVEPIIENKKTKSLVSDGKKSENDTSKDKSLNSIEPMKINDKPKILKTKSNQELNNIPKKVEINEKNEKENKESETSLEKNKSSSKLDEKEVEEEIQINQHSEKSKEKIPEEKIVEVNTVSEARKYISENEKNNKPNKISMKAELALNSKNEPGNLLIQNVINGPFFKEIIKLEENKNYSLEYQKIIEIKIQDDGQDDMDKETDKFDMFNFKKFLYFGNEIDKFQTLNNKSKMNNEPKKEIKPQEKKTNAVQTNQIENFVKQFKHLLKLQETEVKNTFDSKIKTLKEEILNIIIDKNKDIGNKFFNQESNLFKNFNRKQNDIESEIYSILNLVNDLSKYTVKIKNEVSAFKHFLRDDIKIKKEIRNKFKNKDKNDKIKEENIKNMITSYMNQFNQEIKEKDSKIEKLQERIEKLESQEKFNPETLSIQEINYYQHKDFNIASNYEYVRKGGSIDPEKAESTSGDKSSNDCPTKKNLEKSELKEQFGEFLNSFLEDYRNKKNNPNKSKLSAEILNKETPNQQFYTPNQSEYQKNWESINHRFYDEIPRDKRRRQNYEYFPKHSFANEGWERNNMSYMREMNRESGRYYPEFNSDRFRRPYREGEGGVNPMLRENEVLKRRIHLLRENRKIRKLIESKQSRSDLT